MMKRVLLVLILVCFVCSASFSAEAAEKPSSKFITADLNLSGLGLGFGMEGASLGFDAEVSVSFLACITAESFKGLLDPLLRLNGYWKLVRGECFNLAMGLSGYAFFQFDDASKAKTYLFWGPGLDLVFRFKGGHSFFVSGTYPIASLLSSIDDRIGGDSDLVKYGLAVIDCSGNGGCGIRCCLFYLPRTAARNGKGRVPLLFLGKPPSVSLFNRAFCDSFKTMTISSKQRSILRACAMELEPVVMVGKDGVKETVITALDEALHVHELVKVRFVSHKDEVEPFSRELEEKTSSVLVAVTGFTAVYFRQDEEDRSKRIYHI